MNQVFHHRSRVATSAPVETYGWDGRMVLRLMLFIPRLHDQAGSTSWLYVSWTSQLDVCSMLDKCLLDVCSMSAGCLLNRVNGILPSLSTAAHVSPPQHSSVLKHLPSASTHYQSHHRSSFTVGFKNFQLIPINRTLKQECGLGLVSVSV